MDIGSSTIRAGYAGDDTPKAIIPTSYGYTEEESTGEDVVMDESNKENGQLSADNAPSSSKKSVKLHIGQNGPSMFRPNMHVGNPMKEGLSMFIHLRCKELGVYLTLLSKSMILLLSPLWYAMHSKIVYMQIQQNTLFL